MLLDYIQNPARNDSSIILIPSQIWKIWSIGKIHRKSNVPPVIRQNALRASLTDEHGDDRGRDVHHVTVGTKAVREAVEGVEATDDKKSKSQKYRKPAADTIEKEEILEATTETAKTTSKPQGTTEVTAKDVLFTTEVAVQTAETVKTEQETCRTPCRSLS
ncbi:unnamed protein product [Phytophthora fragariaefolia]|uniref:Unnamed protein product n=1 Tax=Phytophthora fragariaefolia TaxID=1490495 RepID=A0A9W6YF25_9STRA|nr:unnamed protein product [Phytophthora fragariaefolia]